MDNEEFQLVFFLTNIKKYLSNLCDNCIDEICDSTVQKILMSNIEPHKKIETYLKIIKEKRNKIECDYRNLFEDENDSKENITKHYLKSDSENNSHLSDCDGNCGKSTSIIDLNRNNNHIKSETSIKYDSSQHNKKNKGNKKKRKRNAT